MATTHVGSLYFDISIKGIEQVKRQLNSLQSQINAMKRKEGVLSQIFGGAKGLLGIGTILGNVSRVITRFGDTLTHFGQITSVFSYRLSILVAGLAAFGVKIGVVAAEFEENLAQIGTQLDIRGESLETFTTQLGETIIELSKTIPVAANDIARAMYFIVSSMSIPDETAEAMLEPLSKAAVAGRTSVEDMAGAVAVIGNVYDHILVMADGTARFVEREMEGAIALTDATRDQVTAAVTHTTDVLFEAVREGRAEVSDYTTQVGDFLQVAAEAGASFEEAMATYTAMTRVTTASQAATWTANFYRQLLRPEFGETLAEWGIQIEQVVEGTGRWATAEAGLTEKQQKRVEILKEYIKDTQRAIGFRGAQLGIGDEFAERIQTWFETGVLLPGVTNAWVEKVEDLNAAQDELNGLLAEGGRQVSLWTGEREIRPTLDIFTDLVEKINSASSEQAKLNMITEAFPNIRATQAFLRFIGAYEDIVTWSREWQEATGQTEEAFAIMADTVNARITILKNNIYALGMAFYLAHEEQIQTFIDGLTAIVMLFQQLDPALVRQIALWGFLLISLAPIMLLIGTISIGLGTIVTAIGMLVSPWVLAAAVVLFGVFGDKLKIAWDALSKYGISDMKDVVQFFMDLAVQLGIIEESEAVKIMEAFGISLKPMGDPAVLKFIDAFKGMVDRIVTVKDDLVEWFDAFRLLLEDIEKRQGTIGTIVGYIEKLAGIVLPFLGKQAAPTGVEVGRYLPGGEAGPEEKAGVLETGIVVGLGTKIVTAILGALGISGGVALTGVIAGAIYAAMHPEEVETFFTTTLPEWWNNTAFPVIRDFWEIELPLFWNGKVMPHIEYYYNELLKWWTGTGFPMVKKFWEEDLPLAIDEGVSKPSKGFWEEKLLPWLDGLGTRAKESFVNFMTTGMNNIVDNVSASVSNFFTVTVKEALTTFFTETAPRKTGYWLGYAAGKIAQFILYLTDNFDEWVHSAFAALWEIIKDLVTNFIDNVLALYLKEDLGPSLIDKIVAVVKEQWEAMKKSWDSFLEGIKKGFWGSFGLTPPAPTPTDRDACLAAGGSWVVEQGVGRCVMQHGGIVRRDMTALLHRGEVVFNPQHPRQDLARVVNAAIGRAGGGGGGGFGDLVLTPTVNINTFAGTQTEMNQLQRMLENMSFDMAMRVERKLAEARRVENRRRE